MVAFGRLVVAMDGGTVIWKTAVAIPEIALPQKALALSVVEVVSGIAVFAYAVELLVGAVPSNV